MLILHDTALAKGRKPGLESVDCEILSFLVRPRMTKLSTRKIARMIDEKEPTVRSSLVKLEKVAVLMSVYEPSRNSPPNRLYWVRGVIKLVLKADWDKGLGIIRGALSLFSQNPGANANACLLASCVSYDIVYPEKRKSSPVGFYHIHLGEYFRWMERGLAKLRAPEKAQWVTLEGQIDKPRQAVALQPSP